MKKIAVAKNDYDEVVTKGYLRKVLDERFGEFQKKLDKLVGLVVEEFRLAREERKDMRKDLEILHRNDFRQEVALDALVQRVEVLESVK